VPELTAVEEQRVEVGDLDLLDLADDDQVIAAVVRAPGPARDCRGRALEQRGGGAIDPLRRHRGGASGEVPGDVELVVGEHVDREGLPREVLARLGAAAERDLGQRRLQGNGGERVDGRAVRVAVLVGAGDDGDAGGEPAECVPELSRIHLFLLYAVRTRCTLSVPGTTTVAPVTGGCQQFN